MIGAPNQHPGGVFVDIIPLQLSGLHDCLMFFDGFLTLWSSPGAKQWALLTLVVSVYIYINIYIYIEREPKEAHCFALGELQNPEKHQKVSKRES